MAGIIAPGVCRYTVVGTFAGRPVANVLDYLIVSDVPAARGVNVAEMASVLVQGWIDNILENVDAHYTAQEVTYVDLDSVDGTVGSTTLGTSTNLPQAGTQVGDALPGNVAVRVNKNIAAVRGQRQGRMYLPGLVEASTDPATPNSPNAGYIAALNADLAAFINETNIDAGDPQAWQSTLVVVHTVNQGTPQAPDIVFNGTSVVNTMTVDPILGSQRRRLRG